MDVPELHCPKTKAWNRCALDALGAPWADSVRIPFLNCVSGRKPKWGTEVRLGWEDHAFHGLFLCQDPDPWATKTRRDDTLWEEEVVEIFLDPFGDSLAYFQIVINPLNAVADLFIRRTRTGLKKDLAWDCQGLATACGTLAYGWIAAFQIPFQALGDCHPTHHPVWRANFARIERPKNEKRELTAWSPSFVESFHVLERFGKMRFEP